ncbi:MAG TPA: universal stress protein, partial [Chloroflexota bacterium]
VSNTAKDYEAQSRVYLEGIAGPLRARAINVETRVIDAPAMNAILEEVNRSPETLVIMCTHGRTGIERLLAGNVAQQLLQKSRVPVLLLRLSGSDATAEGVDLSMDVRIGTEVMGKSGKIGEVHRVIVDARSGTSRTSL